MSWYSPFDKPFKEVTSDDLEILTRTYEGWHIEYKEAVSKPPDIAKSISAFANTQGGWLFYGIKEKSKSEPVAGSFPGIERAEVEAARQRIQQSVAAYVTPPPYFDSKVLWGQCDLINLAADRGVISVHVPWSLAAPHVHKNGRIYRRVGEGSDPKPENDRFLLDQLWRRPDTLKKEYRQWINRDQEFSDAEREVPFVRLCLVPNLWGDRDIRRELTIDDVREIMRASGTPLWSLPFETVYTGANGFRSPPKNTKRSGQTWVDMAAIKRVV